MGTRRAGRRAFPATAFRRFKAQDVRWILEAGTAPAIVARRQDLAISIADVPTRSLHDYALETRP